MTLQRVQQNISSSLKDYASRSAASRTATSSFSATARYSGSRYSGSLFGISAQRSSTGLNIHSNPRLNDNIWIGNMRQQLNSGVHFVDNGYMAYVDYSNENNKPSFWEQLLTGLAAGSTFAKGVFDVVGASKTSKTNNAAAPEKTNKNKDNAKGVEDKWEMPSYSLDQLENTKALNGKDVVTFGHIQNLKDKVKDLSDNLTKEYSKYGNDAFQALGSIQAVLDGCPADIEGVSKLTLEDLPTLSTLDLSGEDPDYDAALKSIDDDEDKIAKYKQEGGKSLKEHQGSVNEALTRIGGEIAKIDGTISELKTQLKSLPPEKQGDIEADIKKLEDDKRALEAQQQKLEAYKGKLPDAITNFNTSLQDLLNKLGVAQTQVVDIKKFNEQVVDKEHKVVKENEKAATNAAKDMDKILDKFKNKGTISESDVAKYKKLYEKYIDACNNLEGAEVGTTYKNSKGKDEVTVTNHKDYMSSEELDPKLKAADAAQVPGQNKNSQSGRKRFIDIVAGTVDSDALENLNIDDLNQEGQNDFEVRETEPVSPKRAKKIQEVIKQIEKLKPGQKIEIDAWAFTYNKDGSFTGDMRYSFGAGPKISSGSDKKFSMDQIIEIVTKYSYRNL